MEIESWRDAMLVVAGNLNPAMTGAAVSLDIAANQRRTVYGEIARRDLNRMLQLYDFPEPTSHSPRRQPTTTPLQQLFVLNSPFIRSQAASLAARVRTEAGSVDERIDRIHMLLFSRRATDDERTLGHEFVSVDSLGVWPDYAQALLGLNEFLFVD